MKKKKLIVYAVLIVMAGVFLAGMAVVAKLKANLNELTSMEIADVDLLTIKDGVYRGSYEKFPVNAEVRVTVKEHRIIGIELVDHGHGRGETAEIIPDKVVEAQSLEVDAVTGATFSSRVILKAIENALTTAVPR